MAVVEDAVEQIVIGLLAGTTMYVSSANFTSSFPGATAFRSAALTTYAAGSTADP